ncbi:MAG: tetratricopeptide repeat protein [Stappiaceae bacterium]
MQINNIKTTLFALCISFAASQAFALDANRQNNSDASPLDAFKAGTQAYYSGQKQEALDALSYAADQGHPLAQWKLARMYAVGDGVAEDDFKAFKYFSLIANEHADESPHSSKAPFVASSFVALGSYYLTGITDSPIDANPTRARDLFTYAASYFGDADAQYYLGKLYLSGEFGENNPTMAARWLKLAAAKGQIRAQATLGNMLFVGEEVPQNKARGLMWMNVARINASRKEDAWIHELQERASGLVTDEDRLRATGMAELWIEQHASR